MKTVRVTPSSIIRKSGHSQLVANKQALLKSLEELSQCFEKHCRLLRAGVFTEGRSYQIEEPACGDGCPYRREYRSTLIDTITVLEGTRKNFKSKQIETLRKKLTKTLVQI